MSEMIDAVTAAIYEEAMFHFTYLATRAMNPVLSGDSP